MTIHDEILKLRNSIQSRLSHISAVPVQKPYGHTYTATIIAGGQAHTDVFRFNPHTYASEFNMDGVLLSLVEKAGLVEGKLTNVECTAGVLSYLLVPEEPVSEEDYWRRPRSATKSHVDLSDDAKSLTIKGSGIRYIVEKETGKKRRSNGWAWEYLDESVLIVITAVSEWKDTATDEINAKALKDWTIDSASHIEDASDKMKQLDLLLEKALGHK